MQTRKASDPNTERGAALLEFAIVIPVLTMMLLGTITIGMGYNRSISLNNGARESARYAATLPIDDNLPGWLNTVADVARDSASGDMDASAPGQAICVAYVHPDGIDTHDRTVSIVEEAGSRLVRVGQPCFSDGRPSGERRVQITLERDSEVETGVYTRNMRLDARSLARFERA